MVISKASWREISETTREILVATGRFDVKVCEDPRILESKAALDTYDVIVFTIYTRANPTISDQAKINITPDLIPFDIFSVLVFKYT